MNYRHFSTHLTLILTFFLVACGASTPPADATPVSGSQATAETATAAPETTAPPTRSPTKTSAPTLSPSPTSTKPPPPTATRRPSPTPTATPTPTQASPQVVAAANINVRTGPGTIYVVIATLPPDLPLPIIGRNEEGSWWQIEGPDGNHGWVADSVVTARHTDEVTLVATPPPPDPPTPTPPPIPAVDFRIATWRLLPLALNSGCAKGMHTIFITVQDVNGTPLNNIVVGDSWNNVETVSGSKGNGKAEIDLWTNTMEMVIKRDAATDQTYSSEVSFPFSSFMTTIPNEVMVEAGYCANEAECQWKRENESYFCGGHYSWEVTFQKTY